jgi:hypothetical protein
MSEGDTSLAIHRDASLSDSSFVTARVRLHLVAGGTQWGEVEVFRLITLRLLLVLDILLGVAIRLAVGLQWCAIDQMDLSSFVMHRIARLLALARGLGAFIGY